MNDLIYDRLEEIVNLQDIIKTNNLLDKSKRSKVYYFSEYHLSIVF